MNNLYFYLEFWENKDLGWFSQIWGLSYDTVEVDPKHLYYHPSKLCVIESQNNLAQAVLGSALAELRLSLTLVGCIALAW